MRHEFHIGVPDAGRRVDRYLQRALGVPPSLVQKLLRKGKVRRQDGRLQGSDRLADGDLLVVHHVATGTTTRPPDVDVGYAGPRIQLLWRDDHYMALNKPAGVRCSEDGDPTLSVQAWLREELAAEIRSGQLRPELCHRLDAGTTGVVLVALSSAAFTAFHEAMGRRKVVKDYRVLVWGKTRKSWNVDHPLLRSTHARRTEPKVALAQEGDSSAKAAVTEFRRLSSSAESTLLSARPITGRTHQIRAHLKGTELPVVGDFRYGSRKLDEAFRITEICPHQLLHARKLSFETDGGQWSAEAQVPAEFLKVLEKLAVPHAQDL